MRIAKQLGALTPDKQIDTEALSMLLEEAQGLSVTFHRAIDEAADVEEALRQLARFPPIDRTLTSGGKPNVLHAVPEVQRAVA
ncbi:copper homeostasis protein CutC [Paenibacillus aestuarii]|uniref:Copper homeostasis protein cutC homolog n=1 Tax=Paenibacillus aestuarii TaxID=516965 RepID=A0ABW0KH40_9BACL|nr:copper homeostasis protein CutC [Paenibacillus aestuarii]